MKLNKLILGKTAEKLVIRVNDFNNYLDYCLYEKGRLSSAHLKMFILNIQKEIDEIRNEIGEK